MLSLAPPTRAGVEGRIETNRAFIKQEFVISLARNARTGDTPLTPFVATQPP